MFFSKKKPKNKQAKNNPTNKIRTKQINRQTKSKQ